MPQAQTPHAVTPWIISRDSAAVISFLSRAFGAVEKEGSRMVGEDGAIAHVEVTIGDSDLMLFDAKPDWPETPAFLRVYLPDADAALRRAVAAGASVVTEMRDLAFGDRVGRVRDPWGNIWWIQTHVRDASPEEMNSPSPEQIQAMNYVMSSLDAEMKARA